MVPWCLFLCFGVCSIFPSRFGVLRKDIRDETQDLTVAKHIVASHQRKEEEVAAPLSHLDLQRRVLRRADLRVFYVRYIRLARTFKPKISPEGQALLTKCYKKLREERK